MTDEKVKDGLRAWYKLCPLRHTLLFVSAAAILLHLLTRPYRALNRRLSAEFVQPAHRFLSGLAARVPFSVAELLIALLTVGLAAYLLLQLEALLLREGRPARLYRTLVTLLTLGGLIYAGFCVLWGVYYYGDDFMAQSGLESEPVSVEQLTAVTEYFAELANETGAQVPRDENGCCAFDREALLGRSETLYRATTGEFPCLDGPERRVKGVLFSRAMSYLDFTGFFFPFTGEANVNMDFPPSLLPSTIAHELAHQRGVAKEQEANFAAVLACLNDGDPAFVYSAALLAYTHLSNALYRADHEAWERISAGLSEGVRADFAANRAYWAQFETPVQSASNTVYESFLHSYDQTLGLKSYGACVDLLVNYYYPRLPSESRAAG
ncbi:MAG: DUF3810 domain-containing protein [Oscillospiraceae bacterium]|nr:DUF3810 domain-containing protein [Oscillospiraceae bacterium]